MLKVGQFGLTELQEKLLKAEIFPDHRKNIMVDFTWKYVVLIQGMKGNVQQYKNSEYLS